MSRPVPAGALRVAALLAVAGLAIAGCSKNKDDAAASGATKVKIELTDAGCKATPASIPAGPATFEVTNTNASKVTEAELLKGGDIVGEKENLTPGLSGTFSLRLEAGSYTVYCPNAKAEKAAFTVTGTSQAPSQDPAVQAALNQAVIGYKQYVIGEVDKLVPATTKFTDAVRAGDIAAAEAAYAPARYYYEEVEPVAESFGDLDPGIDARIDDVENPSQWTGFHRIEKALWADKSLAGMAPIADKLDADVAKLKGLVATTNYQPAQLANGATELLNEVASRKITGEEDRYSHTDLSDFQANIAGAQKAFQLLVPALQKIDGQLASTVTQKFTDVLDALQPYQHSAGVFVDYSTVGDDQRRVLTQKVDALAEPLSQVAAKVTG
ncbi:MAG TPA: iron uptake system protein EfeO [Rugosimonospora sp.]